MERNELIKKLRTDLRQLDQILSQWKGSEAEIAHLRSLSSEMLEENLRLIFLSEWTPPAMDPLPMFGVPQPSAKAIQEKKNPGTTKTAEADVRLNAPQEEIKEVKEAPSPASSEPIQVAAETEITKIEEKNLPTAEIIDAEPVSNPTSSEKSAPTEKILSRLVDAVAPPRLEDKLRNAKVEDLKKAIPLHEKFLYINELYQGEHGLYNAFIELLNQCPDHKEADQQFKLEVKGRGWDPEGEIVNKLWTTIQRKFPLA